MKHYNNFTHILEEVIIKPFYFYIITQICNVFGLCYIRNEDDVLKFEFKCIEQVNKDLLKRVCTLFICG